MADGQFSLFRKHFRRTNQKTHTKKDKVYPTWVIWSWKLTLLHKSSQPQDQHCSCCRKPGGGSEVPSRILPPCVKQLRHFFHVLRIELPPHPSKLNGKLSPVHCSLRGWGCSSLSCLASVY